MSCFRGLDVLSALPILILILCLLTTINLFIFSRLC